MGVKNLVICDSTFSYANFLMENILERKELDVNVFVFTSWENVLLFMAKKEAHILLIDETFLCVPEEELLRANQVVVLSSVKEKYAYGTYRFVYKYQHADQILAEVFDGTGVFRNTRINGQKLIGVYSPIGRIGKTTFAIELGKELSKKYRVLYLNLDVYAGNEAFRKAEGAPNLGDVLYYLRQENSNMGLRISAAVQQEGGLEYLLPISNGIDLKEVTINEWKLLLKKMEEESIYEVIILDCGESLQGLLELLMMCDRIYMPYIEEELSLEKIRRFRENLCVTNQESLERKWKQICMNLEIESVVKNVLAEEWL